MTSHNKILIVYGTRFGQTAKVATRMRDSLTTDGCVVTLMSAERIPITFDPSEFDGIIVGASVIAGKHQASVEQFIRTHKLTLPRHSAFFSVSGTACSPDAQHQLQARATMDAFLTNLDWRPSASMTVAGALAYTKYGWLTRRIMKLIAGREGRPTDTSRDHEFTDWPRVEDFAHRFGRILLQRTFEAPDALGATA